MLNKELLEKIEKLFYPLKVTPYYDGINLSGITITGTTGVETSCFMMTIHELSRTDLENNVKMLKEMIHKDLIKKVMSNQINDHLKNTPELTPFVTTSIPEEKIILMLHPENYSRYLLNNEELTNCMQHLYDYLKVDKGRNNEEVLK